jgi:hypothetical protein
VERDKLTKGGIALKVSQVWLAMHALTPPLILVGRPFEPTAAPNPCCEQGPIPAGHLPFTYKSRMSAETASLSACGMQPQSQEHFGQHAEPLCSQRIGARTDAAHGLTPLAESRPVNMKQAS